jgi:hypothetical protein
VNYLIIVLLAIAAAIGYGVIHDEITARICVEYFTVGHARLIASDSPTVLGLFWGVVATWWVGLPLGVGLAVAARAGKRPKLAATDLVRPLAKLLGCMGIFAVVAGLIGFLTASSGVVCLAEPYFSKVPPAHHTAFLVCGWAHGASYLSGLAGGIGLSISTWRRRNKYQFANTTLHGNGSGLCRQ